MPSFRANGKSLSHMNFHSSSLHAKGSILLRCATLLLISDLGFANAAFTQPHRGGSIPSNSSASAGERISALSSPYLTAILPPALIFLAATPPVDPAIRLAAGAPSRPGEAIKDIATENQETVVAAMPPSPSMSTPIEIPAQPETAAPEGTTPATRLPPVAILHDDMLLEVHPEDVLPYFQFPGSVLSAPQPAPIPASSATYRQR